jgi:Mn-dependent DtxR family transcriptional regulator
MAELGGDGPVQRAEIAARMGTSTEELSVPRARLLDKGLVQAAGRGRLEFTIPGFAHYVLNRAEWGEPGRG